MALTRPEWELLDLAEALVLPDSDPILRGPLLLRPAKATGLSDEAMGYLRERLSRGVALWLVRSGATDLSRLPALTFGSASLDLLSWLRQRPVSRADTPPLVLRSVASAAETPLFMRAIEHLAVLHAPPRGVFTQMPWLWLFCGSQLAAAGSPQGVLPRCPEAWLGDAWLIESCQKRLRGIWSAWSRQLRGVAGDELLAQGEAAASIAAALFDTFEAQPTTMGFLVDLLAEWAKLPAAVWDVQRQDMRLTRWQRSRRARVALLGEVVRRASAWSASWRSVGFVDDDFPQAQELLLRFEPGLQAAERLLPVVARAERLPEVL